MFYMNLLHYHLMAICCSKEWSLSIEGIIKEHIEGLSFCHQCWIDQLEQYTLAL